MNLDDIFSVASLTASINDVEYQPRRLGQMGIFDEEGITTTSIVVEREGQTLALVPAAERGAPGAPVGGDKKTGVTFGAVHLPTTGNVMADEVQNLREFGSEDQLQAVQNLVNKRLAKMARWLEVTHEYQRIGAVKGQVLDADGSTVLFDLWNAFDMTQVEINFALTTGTTKIRGKCLQALEAMEEGLGGLMFDGGTVLCGKQFWADLIDHNDIKELYQHQASERLRADGRDSFEVGGLSFERYRGGIGGTPFVADTEAWAIPMGVEDMFLTRFAPANYNSAVNTMGLPLYASAEELKHGKGWELEAQTNPIHINTRPKAVIKLTRTS